MYLHLLPLVATVLLWAPPADESAEINWLLDGPWVQVTLLVAVAIVVMYLANKRAKVRRGRGTIDKPDFDLRVSRLEALRIRPIAETRTGDVHISGVLIKSDGALGTGARACVYQNRARSSRATAIAADLVFVEDETGMVGIEGLEQARVIAPKEEDGAHDTIGLYLGDRVEIVGGLIVFDDPQTADGKPMHGLLGSLGQIQVRVAERPASPEPATPEAAPAPPPAEPS